MASEGGASVRRKEGGANTPGTAQSTTQTATQRTTKTAAQTAAQTVALREKILKILKASPTLTVRELANLCGLSYDGAKYHVTALRKAGLIRREGGDFGGRWVVENLILIDP